MIMLQIKKRALSFLIIFPIVYFISFAQNQSTDTTSLKEGAWALQFGISSNFTLTSFQGSTFSVKYQLSEKNAIRGGISVSGSTSTGNSTTSGMVADTSIGTFPGRNSSSAQSVSLISQYLWYMNPSGPVHIYIGLGPTVSYSYSQNSPENISTGSNGYFSRAVNSSSSTQWATGLIGSIGVEWFPCYWLSLRGEYGESIQYQWRSVSSMTDYSSTDPSYVPTHYESSTKYKNWVLNSNSISFGLSVYW
jgi:hypothetical protein